MADLINHPKHYTSLGAKCPCGREIECIDVIEHMPMLFGQIVKYLWRAEHKGNYTQDLLKAKWYLDRALSNTENSQPLNLQGSGSGVTITAPTPIAGCEYQE